MLRLSLTSTNAKILASAIFVVGLVVLYDLQLFAQDSASPQPTERQAEAFAVSPPLRDLAKMPHAPHYDFHESAPVRRIPKHDFGITADPVEQLSFGSSANYTLSLDFLGVGNGFPGYTDGGSPPDTNMAVGDTQIVQWVNVSFVVFNKSTGAAVAGPISGSLLFSALGGPCASDNSDIIAQWDNAAHQWLLAQNVLSAGPPYYACVAVSTTADATGPYNLYQFLLGNNFPDYPKWGRWTNSWAQTMNNFNGAGTFIGAQVCMYDRTKLLSGNPKPGQKCFQLSANDDSLLPADIDSPTNPPTGECQFFIGSLDAVDNSHLSLYSACMNWLPPTLAVFTGNNNSQRISVPTYTGSCNGLWGGDCVPQEGIDDLLDSLGDRLMYRFAYYNDPPGGTPNQHWYVNHDVQATGGQIGVRWYEFQASPLSIQPSGLKLFQSGTWSPDANYRWMGSIAADMNNDILVGYSLSSSSVYPSIEVAGRIKNDPLGLGALEPEVLVVPGTGSQPLSHNRWGDYSAMRIDPDGCTFWYTQEYYLVTQANDWSTQIANARFANCSNPAYDGYIELCKQTDPGYPVLGPFSFTLTAPFFSKGPIVVPVGACSSPIQVPSGTVTITEAPQVGVAVESVTAYSYDQYGNYINELDSWTPPQQTATVTVVPGGVNLETIATFTNFAASPGQLKICKVAGQGVTVGTLFNFTTSDGTTQRMDQVEAGPAPGGYCVVDGPWPVNDPVTITEVNMPPGVSVSSITVNQGQLGQCNPAVSYCTVATIGSGVTEVTFTDTIILGSCSPSSSMSVLQVQGKNVLAFVPLSNWLQVPNFMTGVQAVNIEGNYLPFPYPVPNLAGKTWDDINSCASDPTLGQTVCTANESSTNVYVISNTLGAGLLPQVTNILPTLGGPGQIEFTGGCCTTCGVAMDPVHHVAAIGISLGGNAMDSCTQTKRQATGKPAFQFLDLSSSGLPVMEKLTWPSDAGQISEDWLIDPTHVDPKSLLPEPLLLSPAEGLLCNPVPQNGCNPNYEIGQVDYSVSGQTALKFFENRIDQINGWPGGTPDSAAEDCSAEIALASIEFTEQQPLTASTPYIADLTNATFTFPTWTAPEQYFPMQGSLLNPDKHVAGGPIAIAQGGSHEGVLGQEGPHLSDDKVPENTITTFRLNFPYNATQPFADWVTCNLGNIPNDPADSPFWQGADPHTVTAYQSPNQDPVDLRYHSFAVLANTAPATYLAVVDMDRMLAQAPNKVYVKRDPLNHHVCLGNAPGSVGTLPSTVVSFVKVR